MKNALISLLISVAVALPLVVAAPTSSYAQGNCLGNGDIQNALASGQIQPVDSVVANAGLDPQNLLSVKVCDAGGQLVYVVAVADSSGEVQNLTLNAQ